MDVIFDMHYKSHCGVHSQSYILSIHTYLVYILAYFPQMEDFVCIISHTVVCIVSHIYLAKYTQQGQKYSNILLGF